MVGNEGKTSKGTDWLGLLSFGFFLILFSTIWIITPNFTEEITDFFTDFQLKDVTENIVLPAPKSSHPVVYIAAMQFCFIFGVFQIVILALRFVLHESLNRVGETLSGMVFWFGASFFLHMLANETITWFGFLAGIIVSVGLSIMVRGIVGLFKKD
mgnify:FL=1